jgi:hypothetical protein
MGTNISGGHNNLPVAIAVLKAEAVSYDRCSLTFLKEIVLDPRGRIHVISSLKIEVVSCSEMWYNIK